LNQREREHLALKIDLEKDNVIMPVPIAAAIIAGTMGVVGGRLVKKQLDVHNKQEKLKKARTTAGIKGSGGSNVNKVYK